MRNIIENDRVLKIISFVIAVVLWLYIFIILDPSQEVAVRELPIEFIGQEQLHDNGLSVVSESATVMSIKVSGSRKRMARNNMKSIIAKVDVSGITAVGVTTLPIDVVIPFENFGITDQDVYTVDIKVEKLTEKTLPIEIDTEGSLAENYMAGPIQTETETVTVRGPESLVGKISRAAVLLNYGGADVDIDKELPIRLYGSDGKEIVSIDTILSRITKDAEQTMVHCLVVKLKQVPIEPVFSDASDTGDEPKISYTLNVETVQIYGNEQVTSKVNRIRTETISTEKLTTNEKIKVKLEIPDGVKVLRDVSEVEVTLSGKNENR